ncbi:MAG: thioredoxin [Clostridiales bacterium]|nr:thioredoxin [Clostridiales bacterium]
MAEIVLSAENFDQEVLNSDIPVLVDFWAPWCGPCKMLGPVVAQVAEMYDGKIKVGKYNTDDDPSLAIEYNVSSIPALKIFKGGEVVDESVGFLNIRDLQAMIDRNL